MTFWKTFIKTWLPVCLWCAGIFFQSSFSTPKIGPEWPYKYYFAHGLIYALLGILIARAFYGISWWKNRKLLLIVVTTILASLYGLSDEWHQFFVINRTADLIDWLSDMIGSVMGAVVYVEWVSLRQRESI